MKKEILTICIITVTFIGFSQNKKEQIEVLNLRVDSCKIVLSNQLSEIKSNQIKISELEQSVLKEQQRVLEVQQQSLEKDKQIVSLKQENTTLNKITKSQTITIDSLKREIETLKNQKLTEQENTIPASEWIFAQPKYENVTIFFDPYHNQKTGCFLESGESFSAGEIKNGFMEVEYYYAGTENFGWVRISDLEQGSVPKTGELEEE